MLSESLSPTRGLTTTDAARLLRVSEDKIRAWIRAGELPAVNTANTRSGKPRFVILPQAIRQFVAARSAAPPPKPPRRKKKTTLVDFYPD
ncbi:MAG TPA: helix-turn-helix domain-containing protein [Gemmataceae bacterium]|jgi:excisionase family DNA binding protein